MQVVTLPGVCRIAIIYEFKWLYQLWSSSGHQSAHAHTNSVRYYKSTLSRTSSFPKSNEHNDAASVFGFVSPDTNTRQRNPLCNEIKISEFTGALTKPVSCLSVSPPSVVSPPTGRGRWPSMSLTCPGFLSLLGGFSSPHAVGFL